MCDAYVATQSHCYRVSQRRFRSSNSKASNERLSLWTPLIPSSILSETSLRIASVSLSVATNQIAKVLFRFVLKSIDSAGSRICELTQAMVLISRCRVHESCSSYGDRVRSDGIRWLLCEAHLYSHQQHHRRRHLGMFFLFLQFISDLLYVSGDC